MEIQFCTYCGGRHADLSQWPRVCSSCAREAYRNPIPVAVVLIPVDTGVLTIRRAIPPAVGKLALPGGFIDWGESWQQGGAREVLEETGLVISPDELKLLRVDTAGGVMLMFCQARQHSEAELQLQLDPAEVSEVVIVREACELAFPLHTEVLAQALRS